MSRAVGVIISLAMLLFCCWVGQKIFRESETQSSTVSNVADYDSILREIRAKLPTKSIVKTYTPFSELKQNKTRNGLISLTGNVVIQREGGDVSTNGFRADVFAKTGRIEYLDRVRLFQGSAAGSSSSQ